MQRPLRFCLFLLLGSAVGPSLVSGTTVQALGLDQLVLRSDRILHLVCETAHGRRSPGGLVETHYRFRIVDTLKGQQARHYRCVQPGGRAGRITTVIPGLSSHHPGDELILFLHDNGGAYQLPVGLDQGVFRVETDPTTSDRTVRVSKEVRNLELVPAGVTTTLPEGLTPEHFKQLVRARLAELAPAPDER